MEEGSLRIYAGGCGTRSLATAAGSSGHPLAKLKSNALKGQALVEFSRARVHFTSLNLPPSHAPPRLDGVIWTASTSW
jgi:hypothetical protein